MPLYLYPAHEIRIFGFQIRICLRRLPCGQADCFFLHPLGQFIELLACAACKQDIYHKPAQRHHNQPDAQAHEQAHGPARQTLRPLFSSILSVSILFPRYVQVKGRRIIPPPLSRLVYGVPYLPALCFFNCTPVSTTSPVVPMHSNPTNNHTLNGSPVCGVDVPVAGTVAHTP